MICSAELARNGLRRCYYVELWCRQPGEVRACIVETSNGQGVLCPLCQAASFAVFLGGNSSSDSFLGSGRPLAL
jgi:hypothetical protein